MPASAGETAHAAACTLVNTYTYACTHTLYIHELPFSEPSAEHDMPGRYNDTGRQRHLQNKSIKEVWPDIKVATTVEHPRWSRTDYPEDIIIFQSPKTQKFERHINNYVFIMNSFAWFSWRQMSYLTKRMTSLEHVSVARMRRDDLGDHRGENASNTVIHCNKTKQQSDWLTGSHLQTGNTGWDVEVLLSAQVSLSEELRWVRDSDRPSAGDVPRHCITSFKCYIILLQTDTHTHWLTHTNTQTHMPTAKLDLPWMSFLKMFLLRRFPSLLVVLDCDAYDPYDPALCVCLISANITVIHEDIMYCLSFYCFLPPCFTHTQQRMHTFSL